MKKKESLLNVIDVQRKKMNLIIFLNQEAITKLFFLWNNY